MRSLEVLLLSALAASIVTMAVPWSKRPRWLRLVPAFPVVVLLLQVSVEGYRWQMVPAYAVGAVFLIGLPALLKGSQPAKEPGRFVKALTIASSLLGLLLVWIAVELGVQLPVFEMPEPGGPYAVGTRTFLLVDDSRTDNASPVHNGYRTMSIQTWYPAELTGEEARSSYFRSDIRNEMADLDGPPAWYFGYLDQVRTHAYWNGRVADAAEPFPVITYSPSGNASLHKILFEELASQGYVVVSISHPHWSNVLFDDQGKVIAQGGVGERYQDWFREADLPAVRSAQERINSIDNLRVVERAQVELNENRPVAIAELRQWAQDVSFVLDELSERNQPGGFFDGQLDLNRVGVMGFSLGGATAGQFCVTNARCRAGINVDGFMFGDILDSNLDAPFMFIHSSSPGIRPVGILFYEWAEDSAYLLQIAGANHPDLGAPAPNGQEIILQTGTSLGQFPDGAYLARIMNDYVLSFFDKHLRNEPAPLLDGSSPYPEVLFMKKDGD